MERVLSFAFYRRVFERGQMLDSIEQLDIVLERGRAERALEARDDAERTPPVSKVSLVLPRRLESSDRTEFPRA